MLERLLSLLHDLKVSFGVAAATFFSSVVNIVGEGNLLTGTSTIVGLILSCVLIFVHLSRNQREKRLSDLEYQLKLEELAQLRGYDDRGHHEECKPNN